MARPKPVISISLGDPSGVGPEITAAALARANVRRALTPLVFGDARIWKRACDAAGVRDPLTHWGTLVAVTALRAREGRPGKPDLAGARAQLAYFAAAVEAIADKRARALCTAPLSKSQVNAAGLHFTGHTEYLAERFHRRVLMMLAGARLRVALATTHLPLREVAGALSTRQLASDLELLASGLKALGVRRPRIAVCGLNPHAGEGGLLGREDEAVIRPAVIRARKRGVRAEGPFPADSLFPSAVDGGYDAVFAMFHDQGLVALKLLHFRDGVNLTLGLPFLRTSPDHGVAYDLAGSGSANPESMVQALLWAAKFG